MEHKLYLQELILLDKKDISLYHWKNKLNIHDHIFNMQIQLKRIYIYIKYKWFHLNKIYILDYISYIGFHLGRNLLFDKKYKTMVKKDYKYHILFDSQELFLQNLLYPSYIKYTFGCCHMSNIFKGIFLQHLIS